MMPLENLLNVLPQITFLTHVYAITVFFISYHNLALAFMFTSIFTNLVSFSRITYRT